ncbi:MAG TPA: Rrf2 family transcriptional regulator [Spirochaetia bacterium]|nr:Rrf2 family transcriptional regulator [Spirochaetia bacterium]
MRVSEASALAVHAMAIMARNRNDRLSNVVIARKLDASSHHLAKVMRKLVKAGLIGSQRGPLGGFRLRVEASDVKILQIHEAVEGPIPQGRCLLRRTACRGSPCPLGLRLCTIQEQLRDCLAGMTLAEFSEGLKDTLL